MKTSVLVDRVKEVKSLFEMNFKRTSGVYFGKSLNMRVRFSNHMKHKRKPDEMLVVVALEVFTEMISQSKIDSDGK